MESKASPRLLEGQTVPYRHRLFQPKKRALDEVNRQLLEETRDARADEAEYRNPFYGKGTEYDPQKVARNTPPRRNPEKTQQDDTYYLKLAEKIIRALASLIDLSPPNSSLRIYATHVHDDMREFIKEAGRETKREETVTAAQEDATFETLAQSIIRGMKVLAQHAPAGNLKSLAEDVAADLGDIVQETLQGTNTGGSGQQQQTEQKPTVERSTEDYSKMFEGTWQEAANVPEEKKRRWERKGADFNDLVESFKARAQQEIAWATSTLPNNEWIVWWLRWVRLEAESFIGTNFKGAVDSYKQRAGNQVESGDFDMSHMPWQSWHRKMEELLKIGAPEIQSYNPGWKPIGVVIDDLKQKSKDYEYRQMTGMEPGSTGRNIPSFEGATPPANQPSGQPSGGKKKRKWWERNSRFRGVTKQAEIAMHDTPQFLPPRHDVRTLLDQDVKDEQDEQNAEFVPPRPGTRRLAEEAVRPEPFQSKLPDYQRCWKCNRDGKKHLRGERRKQECTECDGSGYVWMPGLKDRSTRGPEGRLPTREPSPPTKPSVAPEQPRAPYYAPWRRELEHRRYQPNG